MVFWRERFYFNSCRNLGAKSICSPGPRPWQSSYGSVYGKLGCLEENFSSQFFNRVSDDVNYFVATQYRLSRCAVWRRRQRLVTALHRLGCTPLPHRRTAAQPPPPTTTAAPLLLKALLTEARQSTLYHHDIEIRFYRVIATKSSCPSKKIQSLSAAIV